MKRVQDWQAYTAEDHEVWGLLASRQLGNLRDRAWDRYLGAIGASGMTTAAIPKFTELDDRLLTATGWSIEVVGGIIPVSDFLELLSQRRFCSSTWLRGRHQLDYLEEPDMFHDTFGHIPLLFDPTYAEFVRAFGEMGRRWVHDPRALLLLERLYWFTIEFGLIRAEQGVRVFGAGILSSYGETNHVFESGVALRPFSVEGVLYQPFRNNEVQQLYFVIEHPSDLWGALDRTESIIAEVVDGRRLEAPFRFAEQVGSTGGMVPDESSEALDVPA